MSGARPRATNRPHSNTADKALANFKHRVRELTGRSWGVSMDYRLQQLGRYVRGWMGYFGISQYYRPVPELDEWIRRRMRMCYWKQWRWACTKIKNLLALGVSQVTTVASQQAQREREAQLLQIGLAYQQAIG